VDTEAEAVTLGHPRTLYEALMWKHNPGEAARIAASLNAAAADRGAAADMAAEEL
jgi:hypothetical protein